MDGRRRRVRIGQVVIAEVALVGVVIASVGPAWLLVGVGAAAGAVSVATFGRSGGRWWFEVVASHRRFARRRRRAATDVVVATLAARTPPAVVWLRTLQPELAVRPVIVADRLVGVASDAAGWFGVTAVSVAGVSGTPIAGTAISGTPIAGTAISGTAVSGTAVSGAAVSDTAVCGTPVSGALVSGAPAGLGPATLVDVIELLEAGTDRVALSAAQLVWCGRQAWVAVRLSPVDAVALERANGVGGVEGAVAAGVARVSRLLRQQGYEAVALDPDRLVSALLAGNGLDAAPQEHWSSWSSGRLSHTTYAASGWPPGPILSLPGVWSVAAYLERPRPNGRPVDAGAARVLIRVAATPGAVASAGRGLTRAAAAAGVRLRRLDGDQAPAAYACGPTAMSPGIMAGYWDH